MCVFFVFVFVGGFFLLEGRRSYVDTGAMVMHPLCEKHVQLET